MKPIETLRRGWYLPKWERGSYIRGITPARFPRLKTRFTGTLHCSTESGLYGPEPTLSVVARDCMRRLAAEIKCDGPPIDESATGEAWLELLDGEPIGCATVYAEERKHWILGAWVRHEHRRRGVMRKLWELIVAKHGQVSFVSPSNAMRNWISKHTPRLAQPIDSEGAKNS